MAANLPSFDLAQFERHLQPFLGPPEAPGRAELVHRLHAYYQELRRWAGRLALVGAGTEGEVVARHFGESLAAAVPPSGPGTDSWASGSLLPGVAAAGLLPATGQLVDLGSGAGFPGLVLAAAVPSLRCTLVESRLRKTAFLRAVARRMNLHVEVIQERVELPLSRALPDTIDCLTARAVRFPEPVWAALCERLAPAGRVLLWVARDRPLPGRLELVQEIALPNSHSRCILDYRKP